MSDVNAVIESVDHTLDVLYKLDEDIKDASYELKFKLNSIVDYLKDLLRRVDDDNYYSILDLLRIVEIKNEEYLDELNCILSKSNYLSSEGRRDVSTYLNKLNDIADSKVDYPYYTLVLDSNIYPETAEHIRYAFKRGAPDILTIDRALAKLNRCASLRGVKRRPEFDRDEYPLAMFKEGGAKAHVFYLNKGDNRGSGSYISLRLRKLKNGTKVRIRII